MDAHSYLEVDVNGEEVFVVDKRVISSYSGKISKLLSKSKNVDTHLKVIFHDFPGGAANFELITRFCYNKGKVDINPFNISHLTSAAHFMEMNKSVGETENLCEQTKKSLEEIKYWTWSELLVALNHCQNQRSGAVSLVILDKFLDSLVGRIVSSCETSPSPSTSSSDSSESLKNSSFRTTWWFEDVVALDYHITEMLVRLMISRNFNNRVISKFLFYYQKSRFASASLDEKIQITEAVVEMLYSLDLKCVSCKSEFEILRVALKLKISKRCMKMLESMIGSLLDQASLDNLLIPASPRKCYLYNVNLVLRLLKSFLGKGDCCLPLSRMKNVARLIDLYLVEIAPDPHLKPSKFLAVIRAMPDCARASFNGVYHAMNLYLEVHSGLSEDQKMKLYSSLNYEKLSREAFNHLTQNADFPSKSAREKGRKGEGSQQIALYAQKFNVLDENEKLKSHLQGMQWRVLEVEKVCRKMQIQMAKMMKSRLLRHSNGRSVPKLCS